MDTFELLRRSDDVIVFIQFVDQRMGGPTVPDWLVRDVPDYEPGDYEWRNKVTGQRLPAQPIRRWVYVPADEDYA